MSYSVFPAPAAGTPTTVIGPAPGTATGIATVTRAFTAGWYSVDRTNAGSYTATYSDGKPVFSKAVTTANVTTANKYFYLNGTSATFTVTAPKSWNWANVYDSSVTQYYMYSSADGNGGTLLGSGYGLIFTTNWTTFSYYAPPTAIYNYFATNGYQHDFVRGNNKWVGIGGSGIAESTDLVTWSTRTVSSISNYGPYAVAYGSTATNPYVIACGSGYFAFSTDYVTWGQTTQLAGGNSFTDVIWDGSNFRACGSNSYYAYSTNGSTWSVGQAGASTSYNVMAYNATATNKYLMASSQQFAYSTNGTTWTTRSNIFGNSNPYLSEANGYFWASTAFSGSALVNDLLYYSTNGQTWTAAPIFNGSSYYGPVTAVRYANSTYYAVLYYGLSPSQGMLYNFTTTLTTTNYANPVEEGLIIQGPLV